MIWKVGLQSGQAHTSAVDWDRNSTSHFQESYKGTLQALRTSSSARDKKMGKKAIRDGVQNRNRKLAYHR